MIMFSIFFIAAFTAIQLKNTLNSTSIFNTFRSRLGAFIAKNTLTPIARRVQELDRPMAEDLIEKTLEPFVASEILEDVAVIAENSPVSSEDQRHLNEINNAGGEKWLFYFINTRFKTIDIFITFLPGNPYIVKLSYSLGNIQEAFKQVYHPILLTVAIVIIANVVFATILSKIIIAPISTLHKFTRDVATGDLESHVEIKTDDELQELGEAFNYMTAELKKMKAKAENANPLTKLPGNIVIMEEVERRIKAGEDFVVFYTDLDNFKAFNDKYGIHKGDEAIQMTADVMKGVVKEKGNPNDLVGHEGGDDFVIVTTPEKGTVIGQGIIDTFDSKVKALYDQKDLGQGFFISKDRAGQVRKFPIMGVSLAGVTNQYRKIESYGEVTNICAEVKKKVKAKEGSAYWIDIRK